MSLGWLKTAGKVAAQVGAAAAGIDLAQFVPDKYKNVVATIDHTIERSHLGEIGDAVVHVETLSERLAAPLTGPQKLAAAAPDVVAILKDFLKVRNIQINDEAAFNLAAQDITSGVVRMLNACHEHQAP